MLNFVLPHTDFAANGEEILKIYMGQIKVMPVSHPARIVIGNPEVLDVANVGVEQLTLTPKATGTTTLVIWDNYGEKSYKVKVFHQNMEDIKMRIDNVLKNLDLPNIYTQAVDEENKVFLLGDVKTAEERERALTALGTLKENIVDLLLVKELEAVVDIDVQVVEMDKDMTSTLGFTWPGSVTLTDASIPVTSAVTGLNNVFYLSKFTRSAFNFTFDALIQEGKARVLSRPRLACQSGKEAELLVGGEKPIFTTTVAATTGAEGTEVEYKEFGIKLKIKPTVTDEERIKLVLGVEVSEVGAAEIIGAANAPTAKAYPLTKRTTSTELFLNNGQTMAISGLIKEKFEEDIRRTPWLSDLPLIGGAFKQKITKYGGGQGERGNTELFVMLTPTIVSSEKDIEQERAFRKAKQQKEKEAALLEKPIVKPTDVVSSPALVMPTPLEGYTKIIQKRILDKLTYPPQAKDAGFQGSVTVSVHLSYSGDLLDVGVKNSSGHAILDSNVITVARGIKKFPPFPPSIEKKEIWLDIPIDYRLE